MMSYMSQPYPIPYDQTMQEKNYGKQQRRQQSSMRQKKTSKAEKEEVWPEDVEQAFREALTVIPRMGRRKVSIKNKPCGRNELIADYIFKRTQKVRTRKQVSSHIQVCKNMKRSERTLKRSFGQAAKSHLMSKYGDPSFENSSFSSSSDGEGDDSTSSDNPPNRNDHSRRKIVRSNTMSDFGSDTRHYQLASTEFLTKSGNRQPSVYKSANSYSHSALPFNGRNDRLWQPNSPLFPSFHSRDFQRVPRQEEFSFVPRQHPPFPPTMPSTFQSSTASRVILPPLSKRVYPRTTPMSGATVTSLAPVQIPNIHTAFSTSSKQTQLHPFQNNSPKRATHYPTPPNTMSSVSRRPAYAHPLDGQHPSGTKYHTRIRHNSTTKHGRDIEPSKPQVDMDMGCDKKHSSRVKEMEDDRNDDVSGEHQHGCGPVSYHRINNGGDFALCSRKNGRFYRNVNDFQLWPSKYRIAMARNVDPTLSVFLNETHVLAQLDCRPPGAYRNIPVSAVYSDKFQYLLDINLETPCNLLLMKAKLDFSPHEGSKLQSSFFFESTTRRAVICDWIISSFGDIVLQHQERTETIFKDGKYGCQFAYIDDFFGALVSGIKNLQTWEAVDIAISNLSISQIIRDAEDDRILLLVGNEFERGDGGIEGYRVSDGSHLLGPMLDVRSVKGNGDRSDPICVDDRKSPPARSLARTAHPAARLQICTSLPAEPKKVDISSKENHPYTTESHNHEVATPTSIPNSPVQDANTANSDDRSAKTSVLGLDGDSRTRKEAEASLSLSDGALQAVDGC